MKIKINQQGYLEIERSIVSRKQWCPYSSGNIQCGDHCPLFHEPVGTKGEGYISLELCQTMYTIPFAEFSDERPKTTDT